MSECVMLIASDKILAGKGAISAGTNKTFCLTLPLLTHR